ncbi:MAG: hypothetical protein MUO54_09960 [Anaerolineales bacterium]|nr:hypothetical protein [Anaerolineales bacterium]
MIEKIQQAEAAIRAGDTRTGFEILQEVLAKDPDSERAWWVMSGLVPREQRAHCLNQVLRINPDNQFARDALLKLTPAKPDPESAPDPKKGSLGGYQTWLYAQRNRIFITMLNKEELISGETETKLLPKIRAAVNEGEIPNTLFKRKTAIQLIQITRIRQIMSSLRVHFRERGSEKSIRLELEDSSMADHVLTVLQDKLGPEYSITIEPLKTIPALTISVILTIGSLALTIFGYWGANEVASGQVAATGSIQTRGIINLLEALGPNGVLLVGCILIFIALGISWWLLMSPPTVTELVRE